jgi:hypothetical protein
VVIAWSSSVGARRWRGYERPVASSHLGVCKVGGQARVGSGGVGIGQVSQHTPAAATLGFCDGAGITLKARPWTSNLQGTWSR